MTADKEIRKDDAGEENFATMYEASLREQELREGEIVKGEVIQVLPDHVVVDIGYKSEGTIPIGEFGIRDGKPDVKVGDKIDVYFKRPHEEGGTPDPNVAYVSFYSPRGGIPPRLAPNHYRFVQTGQTLFDSIQELLYVFKYELPHKNITFHFGWPLSSWLDRLSIGVMVFSIMKLPKQFPEFNFSIDYVGKKEK